MADSDLKASMLRSMAIEAKQTTQNATTAEEGEPAEEKSAAESSDAEGGEEGAGDGEGGTPDAENEGGEPGPDSESDGTTAEGEEGEANPEEQALEGEGDEEGDEPAEKPTAEKWDEEEQKAIDAWLGKDLKGFKPTAENRKLLKIARDNQASAQEQKQLVSGLNSHIAGIGALLVDHDLEGLNQLAEELGAEKLPFDTRGPLDKAKELAEGFNAVYDALKKGLKAEDFEKAVGALEAWHGDVQGKIGALKEEHTVRKAEEAGRKGAGKPVKGSGRSHLEAKSIQNFTDLKAKDPAAQERFNALKKFAEGGVIKSMAQLYAQNPKLADELGAAVEFQQNFKAKYLPKLRKAFEEEQKTRKALKAPPAGRKTPDGGGGGAPPKSNGKSFNHYAGAKLMARFG